MSERIGQTAATAVPRVGERIGTPCTSLAPPRGMRAKRTHRVETGRVQRLERAQEASLLLPNTAKQQVKAFALATRNAA